MNEHDFVTRITKSGGTVYIVGGWVRDRIIKRQPKDKDYVVCHLLESDFCQLFPQAVRVGNTFPVYLLSIDGKKCEIAFARTEKKTGKGYTGFSASISPAITIEDDLFRRDITINSMACRLPDRKIIDPFGGADDIKKKIIRATSAHFSEDPVRALRAARQGAELAFKIEEGTYLAMHRCRAELALEAGERLFKELAKALFCPKAALFFANLKKAHLLDVTFPVLAALTPDKLKLSLAALNKACQKNFPLPFRFATLTHQLDERAQNDLARHLKLPQKWQKAAFLTRKLLLPCQDIDAKEAQLELLRRSNFAISEIKACLACCRESLPWHLQNAEILFAAFTKIDIKKANLSGPALGKWLKEQRKKIIAKK